MDGRSKSIKVFSHEFCEVEEIALFATGLGTGQDGLFQQPVDGA